MCTCLSWPDFFTHTHTHTHTNTHTHTPHSPGADRCTSYIYQRVFVHTHTAGILCVNVCVIVCHCVSLYVCVCVCVCVFAIVCHVFGFKYLYVDACEGLYVCVCETVGIYSQSVCWFIRTHTHMSIWAAVATSSPPPPPPKKPVLAKFPPDSTHKGMKPIYYDCNLNYWIINCLKLTPPNDQHHKSNKMS